MMSKSCKSKPMKKSILYNKKSKFCQKANVNLKIKFKITCQQLINTLKLFHNIKKMKKQLKWKTVSLRVKSSI